MTDLIGATVPDGGDGQTEEDPCPWLIRIVDRSKQMERVWRWNAAVVQTLILLLHPIGNRRVWNSMKELMRHRLETTNFEETFQHQRILILIIRSEYFDWRRE